MYKITLFLLLLSSLLFAENVPNWYENPVTQEYNSKDYIVAVGFSKQNFNEAIEISLVDLSKQIKANVNSKSLLVNQSNRSDNDEDVKSSYTTISKLSTDIEVEGYDVIDKVQNSDGFYVRVLLDKIKYENNVMHDVNSLNEKIEHLYSASDDYLKNGDLESSLISLNELEKIYPMIDKKTQFLRVLNSTNLNDYIKISKLDVMKKTISIIKNIKITIVSENKILTNVGSEIGISIHTSLNNIPLRNCELVISEGTSLTPLKTSKTDTLGNVTFTLQTTYSPDEYKDLTIKILTSGLNSNTTNMLLKMENHFYYKTFSTEIKPIKIEVNSFDLAVEDQNSIESSMSSLLSKSGFKVSDNSDVVLNVTVSKQNLNGVSTRFKRVQLDINYKLMSKGNILYTNKLSSLGVAKSESEALVKAANSITIKSETITEMIKKLR